MLQLITLPIIATSNIIVNLFLKVFSEIHIFFALSLVLQHFFVFFFCKLPRIYSSHKIVTFRNNLKYLIHYIGIRLSKIQYIENPVGASTESCEFYWFIK